MKYGDQSGKIASEVIDRTTQLFDGLGKSLGFDIKSAIGGALAAKLMSSGGGGNKDANAAEPKS